MSERPSLLDRIVLVFSRPKDVIRLNRTISIVTSHDPELLCVLKFKYAGNIQYHKLSRGGAEDLVETISGLIDNAPHGR